MGRIELVAERNERDRNLNIGDECHNIALLQLGLGYKNIPPAAKHTWPMYVACCYFLY